MIISPHTLELSCDLSKQGYEELLSRAYENAIGSHRIIDCKEKSGDYFTVKSDQALSSDGITVEYCEGYLMRRIRLVVNPSKVLGGDDIPKLWKTTDRNIKKLIRELKTHIKNYFDSEYKLSDFALTRVDLTANIDVGNKENVSRYIKILHCMGKVKGFTPKYKKNNKRIVRSRSFDLVKKSSYIEFSAYDKAAAIKDKMEKMGEFNCEEMEARLKAAKGILRLEIRFLKIEVNEGSITDNIKLAAKISRKKFMEYFQKIIPHGDYYDKKKSLALIENNIVEKIPNKRERDTTLGKMKSLLMLIPKKKSLHLAQQDLAYRDMNRIMTAFAELNVSPVTIPKSMKLKKLASLYSYLEN